MLRNLQIIWCRANFLENRIQCLSELLKIHVIGRKVTYRYIAGFLILSRGPVPYLLFKKSSLDFLDSPTAIMKLINSNHIT